jgi:ATP-dependent DNA helicase DinG
MMTVARTALALDWRPYFPLPTPRKEQEKALDELCSQIEQGQRILVAELGTGVGKSAIAACLARWLAAREAVPEGFSPGAVVLTSQRVLQDQYVRDFDFARDLRSASNFECDGPLGGTCAETARARKAVGMEMAKALSCPTCPYRKAKDEFATSELGITNYSYFLSETVYAGELPRRHMLILDEAHNVEDEVRRWATVVVSEEEAEEHGLVLPFGANAEEALKWLAGPFKAKVQGRLGKISSKLQEVIGRVNVLGGAIHRLAEENDRWDKRKCQINRLIEKGDEILVSSDDHRNVRSMTFQPFNVGGLAHDLIYSRASACLLMSATILDNRIFAANSGLSPNVPMVRVPTPFKPSAFGVKLRSVGKMSRDGIDKALPQIPRAVAKILADNPNDKGIIHTVSYKVAQELKRLNDPRLLIQGKSSDREEMLRRHLTSKEPTVLVSPAMAEGLDLRDDLGRFQIICKVPYPNMSDPVVKRKNWEWYSWRTVRHLVQAVGRGVRSEEDWTRTYILDECFVDLYERSGKMMPSHLIDGLEVEEPF